MDHVQGTCRWTLPLGDDDVTVTSCDIYSSVFCLFMKDDALIKLIIFCAVN